MWAGKTFLLDTPALSKSRWVKPPSFGSDIGRYVPQFLFAVEAGGADSLKITVTTAQNGQQDMCNETTEVEVTGVTEPNIIIDVPAFPMHIVSNDPENPDVEVNTTARNVIFQDVLPGPEDTSTSMLQATLDVAELYSLFYQITDASKETVCDTFDYNGVPCEDCPQNGEPYCLTIRAVQLGATATSTPVQKVSASEAASNCP